MAGGGSFSSDQKFTTLTADGRFKTITGGATNLGPCRVTYIMAHGVNNSVVKLHDGTSNAGTLEFQAKFSTEGLDVFVPGSGIRFKTGVFLDLTNTDSVTIGYTG
jgi:hypothetical protein|tara:strand:- start:1267 stop:1581 length:315 start_codon:yes stop_codon:yes gene_type:complete